MEGSCGGRSFLGTTAAVLVPPTPFGGAAGRLRLAAADLRRSIRRLSRCDVELPGTGGITRLVDHQGLPAGAHGNCASGPSVGRLVQLHHDAAGHMASSAIGRRLGLPRHLGMSFRCAAARLRLAAAGVSGHMYRADPTCRLAPPAPGAAWPPWPSGAKGPTRQGLAFCHR